MQHLTKAWQRACAAHGKEVADDIVRFAEQWADEMEKRMGHGEKLAEIAQSAYTHVQHTTGIQLTHQAAQKAADLLIQAWLHGTALKTCWPQRQPK